MRWWENVIVLELTLSLGLTLSSDNYETANCLEWLHKQWQRAVREVHAELKDPKQKAVFEAAYYSAFRAKDLVPPDLLKTAQGKIGTAESYVLFYVVGADVLGKGDMNKDLYSNQFEGDYVFFWVGYYGVPDDQVATLIKLDQNNLWSEGQLRTITPTSYFKSPFFEEVPY